MNTYFLTVSGKPGQGGLEGIPGAKGEPGDPGKQGFMGLNGKPVNIFLFHLYVSFSVFMNISNEIDSLQWQETIREIVKKSKS